MQEKNIAVIGVGYLGQYHAEKYAKIGNVNLVAVVDSDFQRAKEVAKHVNTKAYNDYKDIIDKVDAVSIAVPTSSHFKITKDFIRAGKDILVEKPVTTTVEEADELVALAEENGIIFQVGHLERFNPAVRATADIIKNPKFIESHRLSFFKERGIDVDVVLDLMIHDIDIILSVVKSKIKSISSIGIPVISSNIDIANARIEFENGCAANVTASRVSREQMRKTRFFQHNKYISLDYQNQKVDVFKKTNKMMNGFPVIEEEHISVEKKDALHDELATFVDCIINRKEPPVTGKDGRDALRVAINVINHIKKTLVS
jgi:predicted dehydrogenase